MGRIEEAPGTFLLMVVSCVVSCVISSTMIFPANDFFLRIGDANMYGLQFVTIQESVFAFEHLGMRGLIHGAQLRVLFFFVSRYVYLLVFYW